MYEPDGVNRLVEIVSTEEVVAPGDSSIGFPLKENVGPCGRAGEAEACSMAEPESPRLPTAIVVVMLGEAAWVVTVF